MDKIKIEDLRIPCIIGIAAKERTARQEVVVNITLLADLRQACRSDNIDDTVNYKVIKNQVKELVLGSRLFLLEKLADQIARVCFSVPRVQEVTVNVAKPGALTLARSVCVEITRQRKEYGL